MTRIALAALAAAIVACAPVTSASPQPLAPRATSLPEAQLFRMDKGFMFPLANGARVDLANGWIEPHFAQLTSQRYADLDVVVGGEGIDPASADVTVSYEMLEMAHGVQTVHADPASGGHHLAHIPMGMYGTWRISVSVQLAGETSTTVLLLSGTGL